MVLISFRYNGNIIKYYNNIFFKQPWQYFSSDESSQSTSSSHRHDDGRHFASLVHWNSSALHLSPAVEAISIISKMSMGDITNTCFMFLSPNQIKIITKTIMIILTKTLNGQRMKFDDSINFFDRQD